MMSRPAKPRRNGQDFARNCSTVFSIRETAPQAIRTEADEDSPHPAYRYNVMPI